MKSRYCSELRFLRFSVVCSVGSLPVLAVDKWVAARKQPGSLHPGYVWGDTGKLFHDTHHANDRGCYLAGCTWFEVLFGIDARKIGFTPKTLDAKDAEFLRGIAHQAVRLMASKAKTAATR